MESVDSLWGDMVRIVILLYICSSCSWDNFISILFVVGEVIFMICRMEEV